jgi:nicotinate-nucleotide pyrophosphorylase (carboxylating)
MLWFINHKAQSYNFTNFKNFMNPKNSAVFHTKEFQKKLETFIDLALKEDVGERDHTSFACIPAKNKAEGRLLVKDDGIIAGIEVAKRIFNKLDKKITIDTFFKDGDEVHKGEIAFMVDGNARMLHTGERLILNVMQRMSGIATRAHHLTKLCEGTKAIVLDTRKTTPGIRLLEKWAVTIGGASNHRWGLYDMILIKDNHIHCSGGIKNAIENARSYLKKQKIKLDIEIEAGNFDELHEVLSTGGIQRILLDNFSPADISKALKIIGGKYKTEASGGITESNIRKYALTGVDFISLGALTHSVKSLDLSLKIYPLE